jgi:hypothetical protein
MNKEVTNIDVLCTLSAQSLSILLQQNCTVVVQEQNIVPDLVSLGFHGVSSPTDCQHEVISTHNFCFHRASVIKFLLGQTHGGKFTSQR